MPLRHLLRYLMNNEQLIQKIAESYPIRRAAQLTAYFYQRGIDKGVETADKLKEAEFTRRMIHESKNAGDRIDGFQNTFIKELKDGFRNLNEEVKKGNKKN